MRFSVIALVLGTSLLLFSEKSFSRGCPKNEVISRDLVATCFKGGLEGATFGLGHQVWEMGRLGLKATGELLTMIADPLYSARKMAPSYKYAKISAKFSYRYASDSGFRVRANSALYTFMSALQAEVGASLGEMSCQQLAQASCYFVGENAGFIILALAPSLIPEMPEALLQQSRVMNYAKKLYLKNPRFAEAFEKVYGPLELTKPEAFLASSDVWRPVASVRTAEGFSYVVRRASVNSFDSFQASTLRADLTEIPEFAESYGYKLLKDADGSWAIQYPDARLANRLIRAQNAVDVDSPLIEIVDVNNIIPDEDLIAHWARGEVVQGRSYIIHFHDAFAHGLGFRMIPRDLAFASQMDAENLTILLNHPLVRRDKALFELVKKNIVDRSKSLDAGTDLLQRGVAFKERFYIDMGLKKIRPDVQVGYYDIEFLIRSNGTSLSEEEASELLGLIASLEKKIPYISNLYIDSQIMRLMEIH